MHHLRSCSTPKSNIQSVLRKRLFSTSQSHKKTYAFIGLGRMGYPMSRNLRRKLPAEDTLIVHDIRKDVIDRFCSEEKGQSEGKGCQVEQVEALEDIVARAVGVHFICNCPCFRIRLLCSTIYKPIRGS